VTPRHRVVIVGGGFGGLAAAKALRRAPVEVTVVDRQAHHLFQPLLYHVATGILSEGNVAPPIRDVLRRQRNAHVVLAEVSGVDLDRKAVACSLLDRRWEVPYDSLIVAAGSHQSYFGRDEFAVHAPGLKTVDDALEVRGRIFGAFELAELEQDPARRAAWLTFVVVGAGPTGVEMAGQIAELSRYSLPSNFRQIDTAQARIVLLDGGPRILPTFDPRLARRAAAKLERMGVEIRTDTRVTGIDDTGLDLHTRGGTERLTAMTKIWSAGVQASPLGSVLAGQAGVDQAPRGHVPVLPDCTLPGHPEVFVVGDLMSLDRLPGLAEVAIQSGKHAATQIRRRLDGDAQPRPFRYRDLGSLASVSRYYAIGERGRMRVWGFSGWLLWLAVHLTFLTGFKNRVSALFHWTISFFGRSRAERTITAQQIFARRALAASARSVADDGAGVHPPGGDGVQERGVVTLGLIGVGLGERGDRAVEDLR
jgi:NADH dehydrogenase